MSYLNKEVNFTEPFPSARVPWGLYYKTFYGIVFVPGKPLLPSLMFAGEARAYPSEATFRCSIVG